MSIDTVKKFNIYFRGYYKYSPVNGMLNNPEPTMGEFLKKHNISYKKGERYFDSAVLFLTNEEQLLIKLYFDCDLIPI